MKRHTILIVDDEPDVVQSVNDLLRLDYNIIGATNAQDGARLMTEHPVDVVMTDQRMPDVTGVQFLNNIKGAYPEATRLLFTGYADIRAVIEAINQGNVYRYITKPWDPDELQTIIREACERHDMIVERRELIDKLQQANSELQQANGQLAESDRLKTAFIQVASHELRTPLSILTGFSHLAGAVPDVKEPLKGWIDRIQRSGKRLSTLVNQIISMLEEGNFKSQLQVTDVNLDELVANIAADIQPIIELRKQSFKRDWQQGLGVIKADAEKVYDSINQLLLNAVKFTPDGGKISLAVRRKKDDAVEFVIADSGKGMDEASLQQFGNAFFTQFDVTHHSSGTHEYECRGLGLGATIVRKIAEMHGGSLQAESKVGEGTTVTLTIASVPQNG